MRRTPARWVTFLVALPVVIVSAFALDVWDDILGFFGGVASDIYNFVKNVVTTVARTIVGTLTTIIQWSVEALSEIISVTNAVLSFAIGAVSAALSWWVGVLYAAIQDAVNGAAWLFNLASAALDTAVSWLSAQIAAVAAKAWADILGVLSWVNTNVVGPLTTALSDLLQFVTITLPGWVNGLINNVWCFISDVAQSIGGIAQGVVSAALGPFLDVLNALLKAAAWIVWFALHPLDWFEKLLDWFFSIGSKKLLTAIASAIESNADTVDGWLAKFFGG